ncbi:MAG: anti sigma-E factor RseA C-terminal domain-containing protein [Symbiopectobacterium sp.]
MQMQHSPSVVSHGGQRQVEAKRNHINILLRDYELQRHLHSEPLQNQQTEEPRALFRCLAFNL